MAATNAQVQSSMDQDVRPICNELIKLTNRVAMFTAGAADIYSYLSGENSYADNRTDGPPHLATNSDWLAFNALAVVWPKIVAGTATTGDVATFAAQWPIVQKLCTRDLTGI